MKAIRNLFLVVSLILVTLGLSQSSQAQFATGSITTGGADCSVATNCVTIALSQDSGGGTFNLSGTFVGTLQFEGTLDGTNWSALSVIPIASPSTPVSSATTAFSGQVNISGLALARIRCSAYGSGTVVASIRAVPPIPPSLQIPLSTLTSNVNVTQIAGSTASVVSLGQGVNYNTVNGLNTAAMQYVLDPGSATFTPAVDATNGNDTVGLGVPIGVMYGQYNTATQTRTAGRYAAAQMDGRGNLLVSLDHVNRFSCKVAISTATTIQAVGSPCSAPGAGLSLYITDISVNTNAAGIAADSYMTLKSGTGGTCGTATAVIWDAFTPAAAQSNVNQNLATPIKVAANSEICWINSTAGSKTLLVNGYIAP